MAFSPADIRAIRDRLGLSQTQLGDLTGAHWVTVSRWERGKLAPTKFQEGFLEKFELASRAGPNVAPLLAAELQKPKGVLTGLYYLFLVAEEVEKREAGEAQSDKKEKTRGSKKSQ